MNKRILTASAVALSALLATASGAFADDPTPATGSQPSTSTPPPAPNANVSGTAAAGANAGGYYMNGQFYAAGTGPMASGGANVTTTTSTTYTAPAYTAPAYGSYGGYRAYDYSGFRSAAAMSSYSGYRPSSSYGSYGGGYAQPAYYGGGDSSYYCCCCTGLFGHGGFLGTGLFR